MEYTRNEVEQLVADMLAGKWRDRDVVHIFSELVHTVCYHGSEKKCRQARSSLQAFMLEFADVYEDETHRSKLGRRAAKLQRFLVRLCLQEMRSDLQKLRTQGEGVGNGHLLALMFGANYSAIVHTTQRAEYVRLLRHLVETESGYNHPFLSDRYEIVTRMNLKELDKLRRQVQGGY